MKTKNAVIKYVGLFVLVFSLSFVAVLSMYGNAVACSAGPCVEDSESLPSECGACAGRTGTITWSGSQGTPVVCCGTIVSCWCH